MGVKQLWDLLGVTGRRVEVQAMGNKAVAVDASIWIIQVGPDPLHTLHTSMKELLKDVTFD
jgi:hypothetical protein